MSKTYSPKIVTDGLVMCLDPSQNKSYPTNDLPVKGGLALWLDAADDSTFSYSSGTSISQWRDKSGNDRHFFQSTAGNQPSRSAVVNSRKAIQFTAASSQYLRYNNTIINNSTAGSVFVVWRTAGETQAYSSILDNYHCGANALGAGFQIERNSTNNQYYWGFQNSSCGNAGRNVSFPVSYSDNTTYIYSITKNGSSVVAYSNGTSVTIESSPSSTWVEDTKGWTIGCWGNGAETFSRFYNGQHCEIIIFNRGLSTTEVKQIHTYLGQKWGISNTDRSIIDLSGFDDNGLFGNGSTSNMPLYDYYNKGGLKFDGVNDFIQYPSLLNLGNSFTINFWIKPTSNTRQTIISNGYPYLANKGFFLACPGNNATDMFLSLGNDQKMVQSNTGAITTGAIQMVTAVVNGLTNLMRLYVNGVEVSYAVQNDANVSLQYDSGIFVTGKRDTTSADYLYSNLYALQIYSRGLSATEISQNYEAQKSKFANTIVQQGLVLNLDAGNPYSYAGSGTTWYDVSGNGYNGILTNGPTYSSDNAGIIVFDGTNDYSLTTFASSANLINDPTTNGGIISFSIWVNVISNTNGGYIISSGGETSSTGFWMANQNGSPELGIKTTSKVWYALIPSSDFPLNTWINWSVICNNTNMFIYKNGILYSTNSSAGVSVSSQYSRLAIGTAAAVLGSFCGNDKVSNVLIYNIALSAAQVLQNYNATKGRYGL